MRVTTWQVQSIRPYPWKLPNGLPSMKAPMGGRRMSIFITCRISIEVSSLEGPTYIARHVIGCHMTEQTRVQNALDDSAWQIQFFTL